MRVLVCGGRDYNEVNTIEEVLKQHVQPEDTIIQGGARGADINAKIYAKNNNIAFETYEADWNTYGKNAGYIRNKTMLTEGKPDLVIAFPGGKGTAMMVKLAKETKVKVIEI